MISGENDTLCPEFYLFLEMKIYPETKLYSSCLPFYVFCWRKKKSTSLPISAHCLSCLRGDGAPEENGSQQAEGMCTSNLTLETDVLKERKWGWLRPGWTLHKFFLMFSMCVAEMHYLESTFPLILIWEENMLPAIISRFLLQYKS